MMPDLSIEERLSRLEDQGRYIEASVDLCVNAVLAIARAQCPHAIADNLDREVNRIRVNRTPPDTDTPRPRWRKPPK